MTVTERMKRLLGETGGRPERKRLTAASNFYPATGSGGPERKPGEVPKPGEPVTVMARRFAKKVVRD
jgi:hypothetical protein